MIANVAITTNDVSLKEQALHLSQQYKLAFIENLHSAFQYFLNVTTTRVELVDRDNQKNPFYIDFLNKQHHYRRQKGGGKNQAIAKAIGLKKLSAMTVLDCTAGLGDDAFVLACLGCQVTLLERSPVLYLLLNDAVTRWQQVDPVAKNLQVIHCDSVAYLAKLAVTNYPEIIYIDPMYPATKNSALNKKMMRVLREIVGDDSDADHLLPLATHKALKRVVVKRPRLAEFLNDQKPHHQLIGKSTRYDIYPFTGTS